MIDSTSPKGPTPDAPTRAELNASIVQLEEKLRVLSSLETEHEAARLELIAQIESARDVFLLALADHDQLERLDRERAEREREQAAGLAMDAEQTPELMRQQFEADLQRVDEDLCKLKRERAGADPAAWLAAIGQLERVRAAIVARLDVVPLVDEFESLSLEELQSESLSVEIDDAVAVVSELSAQVAAGLAPTLAAIARASRRARFRARMRRCMTSHAPTLCDRDAVRRHSIAHQTAGPPPPMPRALTSHAFEAVAA